ncbi:hypothetical protein [Spiroplasma phoeniceum]|uniref:Uncharacterized protein n=1 Tax=Spiroplasma phoeniceum P40 TaxID=1276259 RepID=A0A345DQU9_9MOLU|nr:hypothetical protein [Spiroplasma phoeniceum]AXF96590.1 hypothetical protein SDAV_001633 [Spiroplasma phoeniceum P40]
MLFHDLIDLELYDHEIWVAYENNLIKIFYKSIEEKNKKLEHWNNLKAKIVKEKEQEKNQDNVLESKKQETPISNTDPPDEVDLEQLLKDLSAL